LLIKESLLNQYFIYSKCIDLLLGGIVNILLDILRDDEY